MQFHQDVNRQYLQCLDCFLVFVPYEYHLNPRNEKARYDLHNNDPLEPGYRKFLNRLLVPMLGLVPKGALGLDFGCGPVPALCRMFEEAGRRMRVYDPYYADNKEVLLERYDFITLSEVAEHLKRPGEVFCFLDKILNSGGYIGIMTKMVLDQEAFSNWHYIRDLTHVSFYSRETFVWLADKYRYSLKFADKDVIIMHKK